MKLLNDVYTGYGSAVSGSQRVPGSFTHPALIAIKRGLPDFFHAHLLSTARQPSDYRCYGGFGEANRTFARVPWVASCYRPVARTVKDGYFIVLLFRQDMRGCWLSLNQGFTQYKKAFVNDDLARRQSRLAAATLARMVDIPLGFTLGPIDLLFRRGHP